MWTHGPERDCDLVRDPLVAEKAQRAVEIGLAYGSSALATGEALLAVDAPNPATLRSIHSSSTRTTTSGGTGLRGGS